MLALLRARLPHDPDTELRVAAAEQAKITRLRLEKLRASMSPITSHVLDTALGRPAAGLRVRLDVLDADGHARAGRRARHQRAGPRSPTSCRPARSARRPIA